MWNPSLRKTLSHPSQVHKDLKAKYASSQGGLSASDNPSGSGSGSSGSGSGGGGGGLAPSKSMRFANKISAGMVGGTSKSAASTPTEKSGIKMKENKKSSAAINSLVESTRQQIRHSSDERSSSLTVVGTSHNNNRQTMSASPSKLKKSIIDGLKSSFRRKKTPKIPASNQAINDSSSSSTTNIPGDGSNPNLEGKNGSLTNEFLNRVVNSQNIRRWSETTPTRSNQDN